MNFPASYKECFWADSRPIIDHLMSNTIQQARTRSRAVGRCACAYVHACVQTCARCTPAATASEKFLRSRPAQRRKLLTNSLTFPHKVVEVLHYSHVKSLNQVEACPGIHSHTASRVRFAGLDKPTSLYSEFHRQRFQNN